MEKIDKKIKKQIMELLKEKYPIIAESFKEIQGEQMELFAKKQLDYGVGNIALGGDLDNKEDQDLAILGIWIRCNDKLNRIRELLKNKANWVEGEGLADSFMDLSTYGIIAQMVASGNWKR